MDLVELDAAAEWPRHESALGRHRADPVGKASRHFVGDIQHLPQPLGRDALGGGGHQPNGPEAPSERPLGASPPPRSARTAAGLEPRPREVADEAGARTADAAPATSFIGGGRASARRRVSARGRSGTDRAGRHRGAGDKAPRLQGLRDGTSRANNEWRANVRLAGSANRSCRVMASSPKGMDDVGAGPQGSPGRTDRPFSAHGDVDRPATPRSCSR